MAMVTTCHTDPCSAEVLDMLFDNDDGILTQDGVFNPEEDCLQLPDFGLVRQLLKQFLLIFLPTVVMVLLVLQVVCVSAQHCFISAKCLSRST